MPNSFFGLGIGTTGLYTYQAALNTTAHNVSNAETKGYTRQILEQSAGTALKVNNTYGMVGTGVVATGINQIRNEYYDIKYRDNNTLYGEYSTKSHYMTEIENYFNEVSTEGFSSSYASLYKSMQDLAKDPSNETIRTQVRNYAQGLTDYFNTLSDSVAAIQEECNTEIRNKSDQINSISEQVYKLTKQINTLEVGGGTANDLRDSRELLIDELSEIVSVSVAETKAEDGVGKTDYTVKIGTQVLVNALGYNTLAVVPRKDTESINQNDVEGLYDLKLVFGDSRRCTEEEIKASADLDIMSPTLTGTLQALFEVRDGNNMENLKGVVTAASVGDTSITLTNASIDDVNLLNIPDKGIITVGSRDYKYTGFTVDIDAASGEYSYEFALETPLVTNVSNESTRIGDSVDFKGIPYYMSQINEFARTFSSQFNELHKTGKALDGSQGIDFFNATDKVTGDNYTFDALEVVGVPSSYSFSSTSSSYYKITAANFAVTQSIIDDVTKMAAASSITSGVENHDVLDKLLFLMKDDDMFKQGEPESFIRTVVAEIGIDTKKAEDFSDNQSNILKSIEKQRLSVFGVDLDEEAMNLVKFQNAYNLSAKIIQVMDEIYDKLINYMGA